MKLKRPGIPISVKCDVAARQVQAQYGLGVVLAACLIKNKSKQLEFMLAALFGEEQPHLDHDPPLALRFFNEKTGEYTPAANDPAHLTYRSKSDHDTKTRIRGDHGQFSDLALIRREKRKTKRIGKARPAVSSRTQRCSADFSSPEQDKAGLPAEADQSKNRLASASWPPRPHRWPPRGSRPLRGRPP